jgi:ribosomal protein L39E
MVKANSELRLLCKGCGVPLWAVASKLNVSENTLIRNWRNELPPEEKEKLRAIITQLSGGAKSE